MTEDKTGFIKFDSSDACWHVWSPKTLALAKNAKDCKQVYVKDTKPYSNEVYKKDTKSMRRRSTTDRKSVV